MKIKVKLIGGPLAGTVMEVTTRETYYNWSLHLGNSTYDWCDINQTLVYRAPNVGCVEEMPGCKTPSWGVVPQCRGPLPTEAELVNQ